ncbi:hypothetical protein BJ875DRAFT_468012 [Amylocarpus encephaloides]|uniref:Uncharacterized protein n=1 Tax=Amylocarpus encephaloides TaxID=45428 RepID=A0A9P7YF98_9HELO|nr:hypothetical protein BJ875DRAFT_468012 [Amylocarpus encephaloides]
MDGGNFLGLCGKEGDVLKKDDSPVMWIRDFIFSPDADASSLISLHRDGEVALLDPCEMSLGSSVQANAQVMACSPNGRLFELESLTLIYTLKGQDHSIKSIAFDSDSLSFMNIRGSPCNNWYVLPSPR